MITAQIKLETREDYEQLLDLLEHASEEGQIENPFDIQITEQSDE